MNSLWWRLQLFLFLLLRTTPAEDASSQARGQIRATAVGLHHSHRNTESKLCLGPTPQLMATSWERPMIEPASSWILVRLNLTEPHQEFPEACVFKQHNSLVCWSSYLPLSLLPVLIWARLSQPPCCPASVWVWLAGEGRVGLTAGWEGDGEWLRYYSSVPTTPTSLPSLPPSSPPPTSAMAVPHHDYGLPSIFCLMAPALFCWAMVTLFPPTLPLGC